jgi:hypothetical protein
MLTKNLNKFFKFLGIINDYESKDISNNQKNIINEEFLSDELNLFKIPKYLERVNKIFIFFKIFFIVFC